MTPPRIAIIGAGPGGLTIARLLQHIGLQCTVFELDASRTSREQGGIVDLHADSGQLALREAGLFEEFHKHSLPDADAMKLIKSDGTVCWDESRTKHLPVRRARDRPEIDRGVLRDILLDSIDSDIIQWGRKLLRVEANGQQYDLHFEDGVEGGFDLIIGADGAWSKVRPLLTDQLPVYSGISTLELKARNVSTEKQWLSDFVGQGSCFMFDEGRLLVAQHNGNDTIRVYAAVRQPETWITDCGIDWKTPDTARKIFTERYFGDCHEDLKRVIAVEAADGLIPRALYMLPVGFKWQSRPGVTLLGDAAHLMTPFAGVGVNVALADALDLARALAKRRDAFDNDLQGALNEAIEEYEETMFARAKENMEKTWVGLQNHFSATGIDDRVRRLERGLQKLEERAKQIEQIKVPSLAVSQ